MLPLFYKDINVGRGTKVPQTSFCYNSYIYDYFWRSLYQRLTTRFDWHLPDTWDKDHFEFALYSRGFVGIFDTNKYASTLGERFGIIPCVATVHGVGVQLQPTEIRTANRFFFMKKSAILYKEAGMIKLTSDYDGILDIIDFYAERLAILYSSIDQSIINARFAYVISANSEAASATLKAIFDQRNSGKPLIVYDKDKLRKKNAVSKTEVLSQQDPFELLDLKVGSNYITDKLLRDYRNIMNQFDTEIGIPNNPADKAERLVTNEVESNSAETVSRFDHFMSNLETSIEKTINVFPELKGQLSVKAHQYDTGQTGAKEAGKEVANVKQIDTNRNG